MPWSWLTGLAGLSPGAQSYCAGGAEPGAQSTKLYGIQKRKRPEGRLVLLSQFFFPFKVAIAVVLAHPFHEVR